MFQTPSFGHIFGLRNKALKAFCLALLLAAPILAAPAAQAKENPKYASIVMDADTGLILYQRHADKRLHPASLTKVMTLLMLFEAMDQGKVGLNDRIRISKHAAAMSPSKLGLAPGQTIKVKDAIYALVTKSANDIAAAVAEHLGGTESNFARMMTARAHALGMTSTTFKNASGLHNPGQYSTARDMAKMARFVINDYPGYYRYFSTKNFAYNGQSYHNHNRLMSSYKGMDGMKTGYIGPSGFNLVASAVRNNHRLIGVVFGGRSAQSRNDHMAGLLDKGFAQINDIRIASAKVPIPPRKPGILLAVNALSNAAGTARASAPAYQQTVALDPAIANGSFSEIIGEGDYDPAATERIETGLIAIAAHRSEEKAVLAAAQQVDAWAIQVGAFTSRAATDSALNTTLRKLPREYAEVSPVIAPLKTREGWLYRARLSGFTKDQAFKACNQLQDCLPVAPHNN